jgi:hypothetical protein
MPQKDPSSSGSIGPLLFLAGLLIIALAVATIFSILADDD